MDDIKPPTQNQNPTPNLVQNPGPTQPVNPNPAPQFTPQEPEPKKGGKKKLIIITLILVLLLAGAGAAWFLVFNKDEEATDTTTSQNQEEVVEESALTESIVLNAEKLQYIDKDNKLVDLATMEEDEAYIGGYLNEENKLVAYYLKTVSETGVSSLGTIENGEKSITYELPAYTTRFYEPSLSPDYSKLLTESYNVGNTTLSSEFFVVDLSNGEAKSVYNVTENQDSFMVIIGWLNNEEVLLQEQSCRECDGPRKPILNKLNVSTGELTEFFDGTSTVEGQDSASFALSSDKSTVFYNVMGVNRIFNNGPETTPEPLGIFTVDLQTKEAKKVVDIDDYFAEIIDYSADGSKAYLSVADLVEETESNETPIYTTDNGNFYRSKSKIVEVDVASGEAKELSIESQYLSENSYVSGYVTEKGLILNIYKNDPNNNTPGATYTILDIDMSGEEYNLTAVLENTLESDLSVKLYKVN